MIPCSLIIGHVRPALMVLPFWLDRASLIGVHGFIRFALNRCLWLATSSTHLNGSTAFCCSVGWGSHMSRRTGRQFRGRSWASAADYLSPWLSACGKPFRSRRGQCAQRAAATSAIDDRRPGGNVRRRTPNALHRVEMGAWACAPNPATKILPPRPPSRVRP